MFHWSFPLTERVSKKFEMPLFYKIDKERKLVLITGSDYIALRDVLTVQEKFRNDPNFDLTFAQLIDLTHVKKLDLNATEIKQIADNAVPLPGIRRAFIVSDDTAFRFAQMYKSYREEAQDSATRVFRELDQALHWVLSEGQEAPN
jgi:cystathionine beta-lyase family protein involved in aluminum resistance